LDQNVGLKVVGAIGALMVAIGFGFLFYQLSHYSIFSAALMAFSAFALLGAGNFVILKKFNVLGQTLLALGSTLLFSSIIYAFMRGILPNFWWAGGLSVFAVILVILMAIAQNSEIVMSYSLIGGAIPLYFYMVFREFGDEPSGMVDFDFNLLFGYILSLQLGILVISLWKEWKWTKIFSYLPFFPALLIAGFSHSTVSIGMSATTVSLLLFQVAILLTPFIRSTILTIPEHIALGVNTLISSSLIFLFIDKMGKNDFMGLSAFVMIGVYSLIALVYWFRRSNDRVTLLILLSSILVFAFSAIPMQFGADWNMIGWSIMALSLIVIGSQFKQFLFEIFGFIVLLISFFYFVIYDIIIVDPFKYVSYLANHTEHLFFIKATFMVLVIGAITTIYALKERHGKVLRLSKDFSFFEIGKVLAYITLQIYSIYFAIYFFHQSGIHRLMSSSIEDYSVLALIALLSSGISLLFTLVPIIRAKSGTVLRLIAEGVASIFTLILLFSTDLFDLSFHKSLPVQSLFALFTIALTLISVLNLFFTLKRFYLDGHLRFSFVWLFSGIAILIWATLFNLTQVHENSAVIAAITYSILSVLFIFVGFLKGILSIRLIGLGTLLLAIIIAFIRIAWNESNYVRFFAFVAIGVLSILIVVIYSVVDKKLKSRFSATSLGENKE